MAELLKRALLGRPRGLDIDGTLADLLSPLKYAIRERFGIPYEDTDWCHVDIRSNFPNRPDIASYIEQMFLEPGFYAQMRPLPGSLDGARALASGGPIYYITSRPAHTARITQWWLRKWGYPRGDVHLADSKADLAVKLGITLFIEDNPHQAQALANSGIDVFLLRYRYNEGTSGDRIHPVFGWADILELIKSVC